MKSSRSPRASARRATLKSLTDIKKKLDQARSWWKVESTMYVPLQDRKPGDRPYRFRAASEYPEMQRRYWHGTIAAVESAIQDLYELREQCVAEYYKTEEEEQAS